jgi:two-component system cell cycle sensor histidine kinase/response regulator CckA
MQNSFNNRLSRQLVSVTPGRLAVLIVFAAVLGLWAGYLADGQIQRAGVAASISLLCVVVVLALLRTGHRAARSQSRRAFADVIVNDGTPSFIATEDGQITFANLSADQTFGEMTGQTLASVLQDRVGNPGPVLFRLQSRAQAQGAAREEIVTQSG